MQNTKKTKIAAMIFSALVVASSCSITAVAAGENSEKPVVHTLTETPSYLSDEQLALAMQDADEPPRVLDLSHASPIADGQEITHELTDSPSYLVPESGVMVRGNEQPGDVWEIPYRGSYDFAGECARKGTLYTNYLFCGNYSYTVTVTCESRSASSVTCYAFDASAADSDRPINTITLNPGETKTMRLTGLSTISKVYLAFTPVTSTISRTYVHGRIS